MCAGEREELLVEGKLWKRKTCYTLIGKEKKAIYLRHMQKICILGMLSELSHS
jgi:hypothetical protein